MIENPLLIDPILRAALEEDVGLGDVTTQAVVPPSSRGKAALVSREAIVLAGLPIFKRVFTLLDPDVHFTDGPEEGASIKAGKEICLLEGRLGAILTAERTALNFLQRMCGIATAAREYVRRVGSRRARILDTRKTAPGLRGLDKYAVRVGGGLNHRFGLFDGVLIKDNHIAAAGSVGRAVSLAKSNSPHVLKIEVEVEDLEGVREAVAAGADIILLDNMSLEEMSEAVRVVGGRALLEASGGVTLDRIEQIAETGVDFISVGALTHSVRAADLSLEIVPKHFEAKDKHDDTQRH